MEDKQIYTTAKSEEIKRQLLSIKKVLGQKIADYQKSAKKTKKVAPEKAEPSLIAASRTGREKVQNVQVSVSENVTNSREFEVKKSKKNKDVLPFLPNEALFQVSVYTIFGLIIMIILIGIYLSYRN